LAQENESVAGCGPPIEKAIRFAQSRVLVIDAGEAGCVVKIWDIDGSLSQELPPIKRSEALRVAWQHRVSAALAELDWSVAEADSAAATASACAYPKDWRQVVRDTARQKPPNMRRRLA
jgi:hypothetical protein